MVALSVSTSARRSSTAIASPSFLCQAERTPSSIVGDSFGLSSNFAMASLRGARPSCVRCDAGALAPEGTEHRRDDSTWLRYAGLLELRAVRHGHVEGRHAQNGPVERVEGEAL